MSEGCIVYHCRGSVLPGHSLCEPCYQFLARCIGTHPTLARPSWEISPRLCAIYRLMSVANPRVNPAAMKALEQLIIDLEKKR